MRLFCIAYSFVVHVVRLDQYAFSNLQRQNWIEKYKKHNSLIYKKNWRHPWSNSAIFHSKHTDKTLCRIPTWNNQPLRWTQSCLYADLDEKWKKKIEKRSLCSDASSWRQYLVFVHLLWHSWIVYIPFVTVVDNAINIAQPVTYAHTLQAFPLI